MLGLLESKYSDLLHNHNYMSFDSYVEQGQVREILLVENIYAFIDYFTLHSSLQDSLRTMLRGTYL